jgi:primase-polymerase (primpol)-like protein
MSDAKGKAAGELGSDAAALKTNCNSKSRQLAVDPQDFAAIPPELAARTQWLVWRFVSKPTDKKARKVPYYVSNKRRTGEQGSVADRAALVALPTALAVLAKGKFSGVGMALLPGDGLIGIDLDAMIDDDGVIC